MTREESLSQALRELIGLAKGYRRFIEDHHHEDWDGLYPEIQRQIDAAIKTAEAVLGQEGGKDAQ
jgi:hypothetical protein